jgi:hypothetical protein
MPCRRKGRMTRDPLANLTYAEALAAYESQAKLHRGHRIYLVRRVHRPPERGVVLWVADQDTPGDHGLLLYPSGHTERR